MRSGCSIHVLGVFDRSTLFLRYYFRFGGFKVAVVKKVMNKFLFVGMTSCDLEGGGEENLSCGEVCIPFSLPFSVSQETYGEVLDPFFFHPSRRSSKRVLLCLTAETATVSLFRPQTFHKTCEMVPVVGPNVWQSSADHSAKKISSLTPTPNTKSRNAPREK